jgi:glycosyltransferase involved in cell wall biosynthesis
MRLARAWRDSGHTLHLVLGRDEGVRPALADGLDFDILQRDGPLTTAAFETAWMIAKLPARIRAARPDLIFCPGNSYAVVGAALKLALGRECPPIVLKVSNDLERGDMSGPARLLYRRWCRVQGRLLDGFVALAEPMRREIRAAMGVGRGRVAVINNPVLSRSDISALREARRAADRRHSGRRFLAIGRLVPQKNFPLLVRAFARIARPGDRLAILGEGSERGRIEELVHGLALGGRVLLPGHVEETAEWLAGADAFVLSSDYEGLPAVVLEAFAAGLPVIATRCSASMPVLVEKEGLGRLVPPGDEAALAGAMAAPLPAAAERAAAMADRFTVEQAAPAYLALFEDLLAARAANWGVPAAAASHSNRLWSSRVSR